MKTVRILLLVTILLAGMVVGVSASSPYYSYTYSYQSDGTITDIAAPLPYLPEAVYGTTDLQVPLQAPEDLVIDAAQEHFYIVDSTANAVYCFDRDFKLVKTIDSYVENGETKTFASPTGIFLDAVDTLYVADTNNERVVVLDAEGNFLRAITRPESVLLPENFAFMPLKVVADEAGRVFVLCKNVYEGLMQFSAEGAFVGFIGSNRVVFKLSELIWKTIMTDKQAEGMTSFVPVEYTNISLDDDGFIYAVTSVKNVEAPIRRLNSSGDDILIRNPLNGSEEVVGDVLYQEWSANSGDIVGPSAFVDITQDANGNYYALDGKRGRIFAYDEEGNMLFVFGGIHTGQVGTFSSPSAVVYVEEKLYVLDKNRCNVTAFEPTVYTTTIHDAIDAYLQKDYEESIRLWEDVLKMNSNFDLAYMKAGYAYYRMNRYEEAMKYFKIANARAEYSKAYIQYKKQQLNEHFGTIVLVAIAVLAAGVGAWIGIRRWRRRRRNRE
ncbi:MAG: SMP-30/gluconolactonase/LRE family protein [Clostridia bacterium]|nr:SMP-30/gluconolactonase/LRE family protein [Clostridia bacterium]